MGWWWGLAQWLNWSRLDKVLAKGGLMRIRNSGFWHRLRAATFGGMTLVAVGSVHCQWSD